MTNNIQFTLKNQFIVLFSNFIIFKGHNDLVTYYKVEYTKGHFWFILFKYHVKSLFFGLFSTTTSLLGWIITLQLLKLEVSATTYRNNDRHNTNATARSIPVLVVAYATTKITAKIIIDMTIINRQIASFSAKVFNFLFSFAISKYWVKLDLIAFSSNCSSPELCCRPSEFRLNYIK